MKNIYLSIGSLLFCGLTYAQSAFQAPKPQPYQIATPPAKTPIHHLNKSAGGAGKISMVALGDQIILANGLSSPSDYQGYINTVYMDSTVVTSATSPATATVFNHRAGANFDPVSTFWGPGGTSAILTNADAYTVDSIYVGGQYKKTNGASVDTLYVECVWGPANSTTTWQGMNNIAVPTNTGIGPKTTSVTASHGMKTFLTAPNYKKVKRVLTDLDSVAVASGKGKNIGVSIAQLVPAGNVFAVAYTFVPGYTIAPGSIVKQYTGGAAQNANGFAGYLYSDPAAAEGYKFRDPSSKSICTQYYTKQRYSLNTGSAAFLNNCMVIDFESAWDIMFSVSWGSSTVGVPEIEKTGFALGQNVPNPYTGTSFVNYQLAKDANSVIFTVTDITGRTVTTQNVTSRKGNHGIELGSYPAGVYYYTINVDGQTSTKKMIVE